MNAVATANSIARKRRSASGGRLGAIQTGVVAPARSRSTTSGTPGAAEASGLAEET
jgi:hypothetical protein